MLRSFASLARRAGFGRRKFMPYIARERRCGHNVFDFWITDEVAKVWYDATSEQSLPERLWCRDHIKVGDHIVDAGAHHGFMTVLFSKWTGEGGRVWGYDIVRNNRTVIAKNLLLNGCKNVEIRPFGVGNRGGNVLMVDSDGNAIIHRLANSDAAVHRVPRRASVKIVALDEDLAGQRVDFLKVDVEGAELATLRGAAKLIRSQRPTIFLELHTFLLRDRLGDLAEISSILKGYRFEFMPGLFDQPRTLENFHDLASCEHPRLFCIPQPD